jgi:hypothetical protein
MEKKFKINNFIGVFDNFLEHKYCDFIINMFEKNKSNLAYSRVQSEKVAANVKNDMAMDIAKHNNWSGEFEMLCQSITECLKIYDKETSFFNFCNIKELHFTSMKIQKTIPGQGYHVWHVERNYSHFCKRALVFSVYLNSIDNGGETEFLLLNQRVNTVKGRICIFPTDFPYVHRGNPPLQGEKYIVTSWLVA